MSFRNNIAQKIEGLRRVARAFNPPPWMRNKYVIAIAAFAIWMLFFDHNNMLVQASRKAELNEARKQKAYFAEQIDEINSDLQELLTDDATMEKFAREKHMMKRDNEEIFIIVEEPREGKSRK